MGRSPSIADMEKQEDSYRAYLNQLQEELQKKTKAKTDDLMNIIKLFYEQAGWDNTPYIMGLHYDFMQQSEWSMANVKKIIDAIGKAVFGDKTSPLPEGVTIKPTPEISTALAAMDNMGLYIASKVFDVLSGVVESFGSASSVSFDSQYTAEPLGNGFHIFAVVANDAYKSQDFFHNEEIIEYIYAYEIRFSHGEAQQQANIALTKLYEDQIQTFSDKVEALLQKLENSTITPEQYQTQTQLYNTLIEDSRKKLKELGGS